MENEYRFVQRKSRKYIQVTFACLPGKWFSTNTDNMTKAILFAESWLKKNGQGGLSDKNKDITLNEFAKGFFTAKDPYGFKRRNEQRGYFYSESYYEQKQALLDHYILPAHGKLRLVNITDVLIENLVYGLCSITTNKDLANDTKNKVFDVYSKILEEARRQGYIDKNPCKDVGQLAKHCKSREAFTSSELLKLFPQNEEELLRIWQDYMWAVYFLIQYETGWRPGEVAALQFSNFYPSTNGIYTTSDIDYKQRLQPRIKTTNKGQPFKVGILSNRTSSLLAKWGKQCNSDFLFRQSNGKFIGANGANKHLAASCQRAGVELYRNGKKRTQYSFRHSFQSYYIGRIPENARLLLMGHTKMRKEYTHIEAQELLERVASIEGVSQEITRRG